MRRVLAALLVALVVHSPVPAVHAAEQPLAGRIIGIDAGHQLGNGNPRFRNEVNRAKFNGTISKPCNTTGTATNAGLPEATFNWRVARALAKRLRALGARVVLTRPTNTRSAYGPCIWDRAKIAERGGAEMLVSIHADGAPPSGRGFHVIAPKRLRGWTDDIAAPSLSLARSIIAAMTRNGFEPTTYLANPLSVRADQSTLNFSDIPAVTVELGNMRNAADAKRMSSSDGVQQYANALADGIVRALR